MKKQLNKDDYDFQIITDFYKMLEFYNIPEERDGYWTSIAKATEKFISKYPEEYKNFINDLTFTLVKELERRYRKRGKD